MNFDAYPYLDGNAAAGELNRIFAVDVTAAQGQCANCGVARHFAEAHVYVNCPGIVARCPGCGHVLIKAGPNRGNCGGTVRAVKS